MKYLVDVNVLSEATKPAPSPKVVAWLRKHESDLAIDPVVLGEIRLGILLVTPGKRRSALMTWFDTRIETLVCLPWDSASALEWASMLARLRRKGESIPLKDSMIAASAARHRLSVATRNVPDFRKTGVTVVNPFVD
jgi:predicted nucleic acid-binding protein